MCVCAQFSQRATCPPSAAVRQLSIADITFSWPRLTWPALACATPDHGRGRYPRPPAPGATRAPRVRRAARLSLSLQREVLQRAHDLADRLGGDAGVERRGIELGVPEQHLDHADVDLLLEQVGGEAVPQRVQRDALVDPGHLGRGMAGAIELARGQRLTGFCPGNSQPCGRAAFHQARSSSSRCGESIT